MYVNKQIWYYQPMNQNPATSAPSWHHVDLWSQERDPIAIQSQRKCVIILCTDLKMMQIEREREAREWECVLTWMHAYKHLVMIPDDGNFPKENRMTLSPCQGATPQEKSWDRHSTEVAAQAPLPLDEHKAVWWEGGDRRKNNTKSRARQREKKDDVLAKWDLPHEEKADVVHPLQQTVLIRGRILSPECSQLDGWMPTVMGGEWWMCFHASIRHAITLLFICSSRTMVSPFLPEFLHPW